MSFRIGILLAAMTAAFSSGAAQTAAFRAVDSLGAAQKADLGADLVPGALRVTTAPVRPGVWFGPWVVDVKGAARATTTLYDAAGREFAKSDERKFVVPPPRLWSPDSPETYRVVVSDGSGFHVSVLAFCEEAVRDGAFFLTGRPVELKAPETFAGWSLEAVREANCNAVVAPGADAAFRLRCARAGLLALAGDEPGLVRRPLGPARAKDAAYRLNPEFLETRHAFRDWTATPTNEFRQIRLENLGRFLGSEGVSCRWTALRAGAPFASGDFDLEGLSPRTSKLVALPPHVRRIHRARGGLVTLRVRFCRDGRELASEQFELPFEPETLAAEPAEVLEESATTVTYRTGGKMRATLSKADGTPISLLKPGFFGGTENLVGAFRFSGVGAVKRWTMLKGGVLALQAVAGDLGTGPDGAKERFGLTFALAGDDLGVRWLGHGPGPSREGGAACVPFGEYGADADAFAGPMCGLREDTRGVRVGEVTIRSLGRPFAFRVSPDTGRDCTVVTVLAGTGDEFLDLTFSVRDPELAPRRLARAVAAPRDASAEGPAAGEPSRKESIRATSKEEGTK